MATIRPDLPDSQVMESMKLEAAAIVELFRVDMYNPDRSVMTLFLSPTQTYTWQGATWNSGIVCSISETSRNVSGEITRPKFTVTNPNGVWSKYVHQKYVDGATFYRYRLLRADLLADINSYQLNSWRMSKVVSLSKNAVVLELRTALDGQNFKIPADTYRPPTYPTVSVQ